LCDVVRVAIKDVFIVLSFFTFIFAVLLQFLTVPIMRLDMLKGINFYCGLNIYGAVVFSDRDCL